MNSINNLFDKIKIKLWKNTELVRPVGWSTKQEVIKFDTMISILDEVAKEYATDTNVGSNGWIPCSERLPEEPEKTDDIEESIYIGKLTEYNVMIQGAKKATTLYYAGDGYWYDEASQECYPVTAWQPLPEPYQEGELKHENESSRHN